MKKADFELLLESLNFALAYERGEAVTGRVTVREVPAKPARQVRVPLDADIVEAFKQRANGVPYQTQINQALRAALKQTTEAALAERRAEKVNTKRNRSQQRNAA